MPRAKSDRLRVWRGELRKTAGGLTKGDLMRNKKGKIVSKRKSLAMTKVNNLGQYLRKKGDRFTSEVKPAKAKVKPVKKVVKPAKVIKAPAKVKAVLAKATKAGAKQGRHERHDVVDLTADDPEPIDWEALDLPDF